MARLPGARLGVAPLPLILWVALSVSAHARPRSHEFPEMGHGPPTLADTVDVLVVSERAWTPAVTVSLSFAGGHGHDPPGAEGTAWLLGMVLTRAANANLAETGARVEIDVEADRTWVALFTTRGDWAAAYRVLARTLMEDPLDPVLVEATRADLAGQLFFQVDAPVRLFEVAARRLLLGADHPSARSVMGSPASVSGLTASALEGARARVYTLEGVHVAVGGAVSPAEAASVVGPHRTMASRTDGAWTVEGEPLPAGVPGPAWENGRRYPVADQITNSWILAAYPFAGDAPRTAFEFVAHVAGGLLASDPPAPGLISRRVELRELPDGPVLLVTAAVESHTTPDWERRITDLVGRLATIPLPADLVDHQLRSFRSAVALKLAYPEREGRRLLTGIGTSGRLPDLPASLKLLSVDELQRAAAALGEPRILVYGPGESPP